jgi:hypothetical protein
MNRTSTSFVTPHRAYGSIPQLALAPGPPFLFLGKRTVGAWEEGSIRFFFTEKKHSFGVSLDRTRKTAATPKFLIKSHRALFYHVSRTISVHMAQDDSTYRGRNGIGCFHVLP